MTTIITICSPGLIRMSKEDLHSCVWTALKGLLHVPPAVRQRQVRAAEDKPNKFVIVELSDPDSRADLRLIEQRLKKLFCPHKFYVEDRDVSVVFV